MSKFIEFTYKIRHEFDLLGLSIGHDDAPSIALSPQDFDRMIAGIQSELPLGTMITEGFGLSNEFKYAGVRYIRRIA